MPLGKPEDFLIPGQIATWRRYSDSLWVLSNQRGVGNALVAMRGTRVVSGKYCGVRKLFSMFARKTKIFVRDP